MAETKKAAGEVTEAAQETTQSAKAPKKSPVKKAAVMEETAPATTEAAFEAPKVKKAPVKKAAVPAEAVSETPAEAPKAKKAPSKKAVAAEAEPAAVEAAAAPKARKPVANKEPAQEAAPVAKEAAAEAPKAKKTAVKKAAAEVAATEVPVAVPVKAEEPAVKVQKASSKKQTQKAKQPLYINGRYVTEKKMAPKPKKGAHPYQLSNKQIKITLVKSVFGCLEGQQKTVEALGLKKIRQSVVVTDNDAIRGMIFKVKHLVKVENI